MACVSGYGRPQGSPHDLPQTASDAIHAQRLPSYDLERVVSTRTVAHGAPMRALAERLRPPLFEPGGALRPLEHNPLKAEAAQLAQVLQRSRSNGEGRNGYLALRTHQLRGLAPPRKRACLTALHHFFLTRADGTTAAARFVGQKPRAMLAAILASVDLPPAPLSPPRRAVG